MNKLNVTVGFDCDGTLIDLERRPRYDIIALYLKFEALGCKMIVASGGGQDYAQMVTQRLGLDPDEVVSKTELPPGSVDIFFDDMPNVTFGRVNVCVG